METQKIYKIMLLGDTSTGKSSFIKNYISNAKPRTLKPTQGFECLTAVSSNPTRWLQLWDTPGQQKYRMMPQAILSNFDYGLIFYDLTSHHTFKVAQQILKNTSLYNPNIQILLIGNKLDIVTNNPSRRQISIQQGSKLAKTYGVNFIQYSFEERADNLISKLFSNKWTSIVQKEQHEEQIKLQKPQETPQCKTCI